MSHWTKITGQGQLAKHTTGTMFFLFTLRTISYHVNSYNAIGVATKPTAGTMAFSTFRAVGYLVVFARALI